MKHKHQSIRWYAGGDYIIEECSCKKRRVVFVSGTRHSARAFKWVSKEESENNMTSWTYRYLPESESAQNSG